MAVDSYPGSTPNNGIDWRFRALEARVADIETTKPDVVADRVANLAGEVRALRRALYAFTFAVTLSAIGYAITTLQTGGL